MIFASAWKRLIPYSNHRPSDAENVPTRPKSGHGLAKGL